MILQRGRCATGKRHYVLAISDRHEIVAAIMACLPEGEYRVFGASGVEEALRLLETYPIELVMLDLSEGYGEGLQSLGVVRSRTLAPILVLSTVLWPDEALVQFLDEGADNWLQMPMGASELEARVKAALRRSPPAQGAGAVYRFGEFELDLNGRRLSRGGQEIGLTATEFRFLSLLVQRAGEVVPQSTILTEVWGPEYAEAQSYAWVYVRKLRERLGDSAQSPRFIFTVSWVGYRFTGDVTRS